MVTVFSFLFMGSESKLLKKKQTYNSSTEKNYQAINKTKRTRKS